MDRMWLVSQGRDVMVDTTHSQYVEKANCFADLRTSYVVWNLVYYTVLCLIKLFDSVKRCVVL